MIGNVVEDKISADITGNCSTVELSHIEGARQELLAAYSRAGTFVNQKSSLERMAQSANN